MTRSPSSSGDARSVGVDYIVVGVDASPLRVGWAIMLGPRLLDCGTWFVKQDEPIASRKQLWKDLRDNLRGLERASRQDVRIIGIEAPYVGPNRQGTLNHARNIGQQEAFAQSSFPYAEQRLIQPSEWRRALGLPPRGKVAPMDYALRLMKTNHIIDEDTSWIDQDTADAICIADATRLIIEAEED